MGKKKEGGGGKGKKESKKAQRKREAEEEKAKNDTVLEELARLTKDRVRLLNRTRAVNALAEERRKQLVETSELLEEISHEYATMRQDAIQENEWLQYMNCDRLPDPKSVKQLNTYLYVWENEDQLCSIRALVKKTDEVLSLLFRMNELIEDPPPDVHVSLLTLLAEMQLTIKRGLRTYMDGACYEMLRHLERMESESLGIVRSDKVAEHFRLCLWAQLDLPTKEEEGDETDTRTHLDCEFPILNMNVRLPKELNETVLAVRLAWLNFDHFSGLSALSKCQETTEELDMVTAIDEETATRHDLHTEVLADVEERIAVLKLLAKEISERPDPVEALAAKKNMPVASQRLQEYEPGPVVTTPSELILQKASDRQAELEKSLVPELAEHEVNLRRMAVLGGVILFDLFEQPPQSRHLITGQIVTVLDGDQQLQRREFHIPYTPPPAPEPGYVREPEEIEAEMKEVEAAMEALIYVCISLPENVLWFEPPTVVGWDEETNSWTTQDYHDVKFNEDKQELTFRAGRMRPLGLAVQRYSNLPFQGWDVRPDTRYLNPDTLNAMKDAVTAGHFPPPPTAVLITVSCAVVIVEFCVRDSEVCITQLQNGPNNALQNICNQYMKPRHLFKALRDGGLDIAPDDDVACYCPWMTVKHRATERHLYNIMALLCNTYNFAWSRWNQHAGQRSFVFQYREFIDRKKVGPFATLQVTPTETAIIDCTESSPAFNPVALPEVPFYADLFHLVQDTCSRVTKSRIEEIPFTFVQTMKEVLYSLRLLSLS